ncbi:MAG: FtsX-like permease family protein [Cyclobacteriaceae bacterium]|nr:FtsX-like permease family protein [Cyclobacteriaceae bacterium]
MFENYLKIALRNILKQKFFSAINIIGLVIGMACCLLIFVYVMDEVSYDKFHPNNENIYRIGLHGRISGQEIYTSNSSVPVGPAMQNEIPGIEKMVRVARAGFGSGGMAFRYEDKSFTEEKVFYADSNFYDFFGFKLLQGDPKTALKDAYSIVLTEAFAIKYFGTTDALGKTLIIGNDKWSCKVTGITEDAPSNSHFHFNAIVSFITSRDQFYNGWTGNSIYTYIQKTPTASVSEINSKLEDLVAKYVGKEVEQGLGVTFEQFRKQGGLYSYFLYPLTDSHLYSAFNDDIEPASDIRYVYIFSGVGLFILLIACINFMNLSTAQSAGRAKEVGLRKTLGSQRGQMIGQFLSESFLYSLVAIVLAIALSFVMLPAFNLLAGKTLSLDALMSPVFMTAAVVLILLVGIVAGSYPAFYLTSFSVVEVLKGKAKAGMKSKGVRSSLVIFQFSVSTFLIIATVVVFEQLSYMQSKDMGIDKQHVITVSGARRLANNVSAFKTSVEAQAGVQKASYTNNAFPGVNNTSLFREKGSDVDHLVASYRADWDHLDVMKIELKEGRFFSREFKSDTIAIIINEAAVKEFGFTNPLSAEVLDYSNDVPTVVKVVGVVKDFNFESLKLKVRPLIILFAPTSRHLTVRYDGDPKSVVASIEAQWKQLAPGEPFEYAFMDERYDLLFRSEMRLRDIFTVFSGLAIFIACLGLFALAAFTTEQRTKEIGVRKALGASSISLTILLSKEFTRLVLIAIVPAVLLGWLVANWWLKDFTYRIDLNPMLFIGSALLAVLIAWITVAYQAIKASALNPVSSLRYE